MTVNYPNRIKVIKFFTLMAMLLILSGCAQLISGVLNNQAITGDYTRAANVAYGAHAQNKMDIYSPIEASVSNKGKPVIVFFYGGCWGECNHLKRSNYLFVAQSFASRGFVTVIAGFRQYPEVKFEGIMSDASNVMRWTSQNILKYGGDPKRIIVMGHSSGAHIAAMLALNPSYLEDGVRKNIHGFVGLAGPYDFLPLDKPYLRQLFSAKENYAGSQPINFVSPKSPPLLILQGMRYNRVDQKNALNLSKKAKSMNVEQQLILYPGQDHVGILAALSRALQGQYTVLNDILKFIRQHVK